ncbi:MAG: hypothetical protein R3B82_08320 [Sandaracinaceae bacterium]
MTAPTSTRLALAALLLLGGCDGTSALDAGLAPDAATALDAGTTDASTTDAGFEDAGVANDAGIDAGPLDAGPPGVDAGPDGPIGILSGACGEIDDELLSPMPFVFENHLDFGPTALTMMDLDRLSPGAMEILAEGTIGGSSVYSEAFAYEVLYRCEGATLLKSESEIVYVDPMGTHTDMLVEMAGSRVGVSVTRAVGFPRDAPYPVADATTLLMRKLVDVGESTANVAAEDAWVKQILHVVAYSAMHAESMQMAWSGIDPSVRGDTILVITVTDGADEFIYTNML